MRPNFFGNHPAFEMLCSQLPEAKIELLAKDTKETLCTHLKIHI